MISSCKKEPRYLGQSANAIGRFLPPRYQYIKEMAHPVVAVHMGQEELVRGDNSPLALDAVKPVKVVISILDICLMTNET